VLGGWERVVDYIIITIRRGRVEHQREVELDRLFKMESRIKIQGDYAYNGASEEILF
jgi:hypothetical protein